MRVGPRLGVGHFMFCCVTAHRLLVSRSYMYRPGCVDFSRKETNCPTLGPLSDLALYFLFVKGVQTQILPTSHVHSSASRAKLSTRHLLPLLPVCHSSVEMWRMHGFNPSLFLSSNQHVNKIALLCILLKLLHTLLEYKSIMHFELQKLVLLCVIFKTTKHEV